VEPSVPAKDITLGATGDSITISGNSINTNVIKDSGGNVLFQSDGSGTLSNVNSAFSADLKLLSTQTASGSANVAFTSGIDSTYDVYIFKFININPATDNIKFTFNGSTDGGSNYNVTKTTTAFSAQHEEGGGDYSTLTYMTAEDIAQGTGYQTLAWGIGNDAWQSMGGELYLFAPSSTTYVKHFYMRGPQTYYDPYFVDNYFAGYFNTTSAINAMDFKMSSGNMDGVIKLYGL
jgi:hypothetical protein